MIAVVASLLPTLDPVTLMLEMIPLILLYELSIGWRRRSAGPLAEVTEQVASAEGSS